jgi:acyl-CoA thioester hydrolase
VSGRAAAPLKHESAASPRVSGCIAGGVHHIFTRVYYEDTDAAGIVYYANYLKFAERARTELMRLAGFEHGALRRETGLVFAVKRCTIDYLRPALLDDALQVETRLLGLGGASLDLDQRVKRGQSELARLQIRLACLGRDGRPARVPPALRAALVELMPKVAPDAS